MSQIDTLAQLVEARNEARQTLAELHGLLKDLRRERAEIKELLNKGATRLVVTAVYASLQEELPRMSEELTRRFEERFDRIAATADRQLAEIGKMTDTLQIIQERYK